MYEPLRLDDGHAGLIYLKNAICIFEQWKACGNTGLTAETYTGCIQTMGALLDLFDHLQKNMDFSMFFLAN